jgi:serine/threonine protein kinase
MHPEGIEPDSVRHGYTFKRPLGRGHFSVVWEAHHIRSNEIVAIKCVRVFSPQTRAKNLREIALLRRMNHPFIVRFFDSFEEDDILFIVMEFLACGTLVDFTNRRSRLPEPFARSVFSQLVEAVSALHLTYRIFHRDLKTENVLLDKHKNVRLVDFGLSEEFSSPDQTFADRCGSPAYISPEIFRGETHTIRADIWSLGVILFAITHGRLPFDHAELIPTFQPQPIMALSGELRGLIERLLMKDPAQRPTIEEVRHDSWVPPVALSPESNRDRVLARMEELGLATDDVNGDADSELGVVYRILERRYLVEGMSGLHPKEERRPTQQQPAAKGKSKTGLTTSLKPAVVKPVAAKPKTSK